MKRLTPRQRKVMEFIVDYQDSKSRSPTLKEIQERFDIKNANTVTGMLLALEKKRYITRVKGTHRNITILREPLAA